MTDLRYDVAARIQRIKTANALADRVMAPDFDATSLGGVSVLADLGATIAPLLTTGPANGGGDLLFAAIQEEQHTLPSAEALSVFRGAADATFHADPAHVKRALARAIALGTMALRAFDREQQ